MNARTARRMRLAVLTAGVMAAHAWLLQGTGVHVQMPDPAASKGIVMRIVPAPAAPVHPPSAIPVTATMTATPMPTPRVAQAPPVTPRPTGVPRAATSPATSPAATPAATPQPPAAPPVTVAVPGSITLQYEVTGIARGQPRAGRAELTWRHDGARYEAQLQISGVNQPVRTQSSTGDITADGLAPVRFSDRGRGEQATHFERDKGKVVFSSNAPETSLLPGAQDRVSVLLQLAALMAARPGLARPGTAITLQTAGTRDAGVSVFLVEGEEYLTLPAGQLLAIKLTRGSRHDYDPAIELWLAPGMAYVPVRQRLTNSNGDWVDQQWSGTDRP